MLSSLRILPVMLGLALASAPQPAASEQAAAREAPAKNLLESHFLCDEASRAAPLDRAMVVFCSKVFQAIKLGFLPGVTPEVYDAMTPQERADANRAGYAAWRSWVESNPKRVGQLRLQAYARRGGSSA